MGSDNPETLIAVCCYAGDKSLVERALPVHVAHGCPVVILSPLDSQVKIPPHICRHAGRRAYIGAESWIRQREHLRLLLEFPHKYFLINDADSFCVSPKIPERLYSESENTLWSNEVIEPRPHSSPYPKIACQPPYFLSRESLVKIIQAYRKVPVHPITPYIDYAMLAWACEAGLKHRAFSELETRSDYVFHPVGPVEYHCWQRLDYRIRYNGCVFMHPIKTEEQFKMCRSSYEQR